MPNRYCDRRDAGRHLAEHLRAYRHDPDLLIMGLPRGGVPVAYEVAASLKAPMDVLVVRKLGTPGHRELAMGAIATGGAKFLNTSVIHNADVDSDSIDQAVHREQQELDRRQAAYRGDRPPPRFEGRTVLLVDDGLATGSTMRAAVQAVQQKQPAKIIVAVPVAPPSAIEQVSELADEVVCPLRPDSFRAVGQWYDRFDQTSDQQVRDILERAWSQTIH